MPFDVKISVTPHKIEGIENPNLLDLYVYVYLDGQPDPIPASFAWLREKLTR